MKKILFVMAAAMLMLASVSCKKEDPAPITGTQMITSYYTVKPSQWVTNNNIDYYYAAFENADITEDVVENGCVQVFLVDSENRDQPLPYEIFRTGTNDNGDEVLFSDNFTYDVEKSIVTFKFQSSDFSTGISLNDYGNIVFKVCVFRNAVLNY